MPHSISLLGALGAVAFFGAGATADDQGPIQFCTDKSCSDCDVSLTVTGTGYPECVVYDSRQIFGNGDFAESDSGGWKAYLNVEDPGDGCKHMITTPADVDVEECGALVGSWSHAACAVLDMDLTFMYQWCCHGGCEGAGISKRDALEPRVQQLTKNGSVIEPIQVGSPPPTRKRAPDSLFGRPSLLDRDEDDRRRVPESVFNGPVLNSRDDDGICDGDWQAEGEEWEEYTTTSNERQVVFAGFRGGTVSITKARSQQWTSETSAELGFADVLSLGLSFSESFSETVTDTSAYSFTDETGQIGSIVFTPTLKCSKGMSLNPMKRHMVQQLTKSIGSGHCNGEQVTGTFCTGYKIGDNVAGTYTLVVHD